IRTGLLALPGLTAGEARSPRLPELCSVAVERTATAELYWCYGFRAGWPRERRDRPEAACLYLIALCRWEPADSEVKQWNRRLQEEARSLPVQAAMEGAASAGLGPRYELWLALPRGASMAAVAGELRMWWEELAGLLGGKSLPLAEAASAPALAERRPNQSRLEELETRAHWLEEELAMAREQFRRETRKNLLAARPSPAGEAPPAAAGEAAADSARLALLLHMLQVVTELLGSHARNQPAASESLQEIRRWADQMAELLRLPPDAAALSRPESTRDDPGAAPGKP
ncbi:MAG TPA: hypothetical protein VNN17_04225, partial [Terriglobia bacterium]|nr:hypothetical protein [Terriglobia bacterium]